MSTMLQVATLLTDNLSMFYDVEMTILKINICLPFSFQQLEIIVLLLILI